MALSPSPRFKDRAESGIGKGGAGVTQGFTDEKFQGVCAFSDLPTIASLYDTEEGQGGILRGRE
jgi:hypothetical protein